MSVRSHAFRSLFILIVVLLLAACGYRTDLELPEEESAQATASFIVLESARIK